MARNPAIALVSEVDDPRRTLDRFKWTLVPATKCSGTNPAKISRARRAWLSVGVDRWVHKNFRVSVTLVLLGSLGLAALPILPRSETISVSLPIAESAPVEPLLDKGLANPAPGDAETTGTQGADGLLLSVKRLGLRDVRVPTSSSQVGLDRKGIIHLEGTGVPSEPGSNTFIVGHAIGYPGGLYPYVFYELDSLRSGDEIILEDATGSEYTYRVYDRMLVRPADYWVTYPVPGKTIVSLQGSYPVPTFERRLIVRAELIVRGEPDEYLGRKSRLKEATMIQPRHLHHERLDRREDRGTIGRPDHARACPEWSVAEYSYRTQAWRGRRSSTRGK